MKPPNHSKNIKWEKNIKAAVALQALGFNIINN